MASLSTCHLGLWLGWQILLNLLTLDIRFGDAPVVNAAPATQGDVVTLPCPSYQVSFGSAVRRSICASNKTTIITTTTIIIILMLMLMLVLINK